MNVWDVFWFLLVFLPLIILWTITLVDMMGRRDLLGWQKAIWAMVIVFFPWIGVFAYLVTRPRGATFPAYAAGPAPASQVPTPATPATPATPQVYTPQPTPTAASTTAEPTQASGDAHAAQA